MNIVSIEPTPSPNTMMLHLDERLEDGVRKTYTLDNERICSGVHSPDASYSRCKECVPHNRLCRT